nr:hypothetical protein GCM10020093_093490 [Planobispora longispora]
MTGPQGWLSVERKVTWSGRRPDVFEAWDGMTLVDEVSCSAFGFSPGDDCEAEYVLGVPAGTGIEGIPSEPPPGPSPR